MATLQQIQRRIRSVQNTGKITKAMELVAASKMRRAQSEALAARPYSEKMRWLLSHLAERTSIEDPEVLHPLLHRREEVRSVEVIHITPDRGLSGGLPTNLNRRTAAFLLEKRPIRTHIICIGRKGVEFFRRLKQNVVAEFSNLGDPPALEEVRPIAQVAIQDFVEQRVDEVYVQYARFESTMVQSPELIKLLPVEPQAEGTSTTIDYIYEPTREAVLAELLPRYVEGQLFEAVLEAIASEQSARMVAMRNATENANEMISDLTLVYNKARQDSITRELLDIAGGVEAMKG